MTNDIKSFKEFCPALWVSGMSGNREKHICAYSNKKEPQPARSETDFDVMYQCYSESCPASLEGWPLIMADEIDSQNCETETIYLADAFDNRSCLESRTSPACCNPPPNPNPSGRVIPSGAVSHSDSGRHRGPWEINSTMVVTVIATSVLFLLVCIGLILIH